MQKQTTFESTSINVDWKVFLLFWYYAIYPSAASIQMTFPEYMYVVKIDFNSNKTSQCWFTQYTSLKQKL